MLKYYGFRIAAWIVPHLPLRLGYWLATIVGDFAYLMQTRARRKVRNNLMRVLGQGATDRELDRLTRTVFRNGAKNYYDLFRIPSLSLTDLERIINVHGMDHLKRSLEKGRGVVFVAPHMGSFDLIAQLAALYSLKVTIPVERIKPEKLFELVSRIRASKGIKLVPVGGASRDVYKALQENEIVVIAADRDVLQNGVLVKFFGEETTVPHAPALLAMKTGADLIPGYGIRNDDGTYAVFIYAPIPVQVTDNLRQDLKVNSQNVTKVLEGFIKKHPEQWVAFEPVWKN